MENNEAVLHAGPAPAAERTTPVAEPTPPPGLNRAKQIAGMVLVDEKRRKLTLRGELTFLQEMDLAELAGPRVNNPVWMANFQAAMMISAIDGAPVELPRSELQLRAVLQRVGREGVMAVADYLTPTEEELAAAEASPAAPPDTSPEMARAKN